MMTQKKLNIIMKNWKKEAKVKGIILYRLGYSPNREYDDGSNYTLNVCTNQPGYLKGKMGSVVDKYRQIINNEMSDGNKVFISIVETEGMV